VPAIRVAIQNVVDEIHHARQHTEDGKGAGGKEHRSDVQQPLAEQQRGEDEQVLRPLGGTERESEAEDQRPACRRPFVGAVDEVWNRVSCQCQLKLLIASPSDS
jgi:hypothetical protein